MTSHELPGRVLIREVGPRDGFQNEPERISTDDKVRLINALARTGLRRIEVASFVRPDVIPQLDDAIEVLHRIDVPDDVSLTVLVPNERGLKTALEHRDRFHEVAVFLSASETHNRKNVNRSEFYTRSAVVTLASIAAHTSRCRVGTSIAYATGRSPLVLATEARSLDEVSGGRLVLGLGTGTRRMMEDWHGVDPEAPAARMEELVPLLRRLWRLHEGTVKHDGRFYRCHVTPTAETAPGVRDDIPVYTAGVNPRMVQVAGCVSDGLLDHPLFSRGYVDEVVRPAIAEGKRRGAREDAHVELVGIVICSIAEDTEQARREAAAQLAFYAAPRRTARCSTQAGSALPERRSAPRSPSATSRVWRRRCPRAWSTRWPRPARRRKFAASSSRPPRSSTRLSCIRRASGSARSAATSWPQSSSSSWLRARR
jgi:alkanesulfonate monooxygenase SsuD/methylene tetrahydromethanopterin reductase-like flavin-dependent oxidoreductase (luciferase family)